MNILFFLTPKSEVAYVYDTDTVRQVLEKMENHRYSAIPVISKEDGSYIGRSGLQGYEPEFCSGD